MRIVRRWLIYVEVQQDHFITRVVGGDRTIRRQCHAPSNRTGPIKDFCTLRPQLKTIFSELMPRFSLFKPWGHLHFDPVEYPITNEGMAGFQKTAVQNGVRFCLLCTWEQRHEDQDLLGMFK